MPSGTSRRNRSSYSSTATDRLRYSSVFNPAAKGMTVLFMGWVLGIAIVVLIVAASNERAESIMEIANKR
ncbi:hypothetical protein [Cohnella soli]|uniref:Uncharacterized protein n=1 Tax=Cohnella soli TaxID=425005 RepID=A0ABW0HTJ9_9BACL